MFDHFVVSVVICPVVVALTVRWLAGRLRPEAAVTFLVRSLAIAAAACLTTLAAFAVKAVAELSVTGSLFHFSDRVVRADTAAEPWVSWLSVALAAAAVTGITRVWHVHRRDVAYARRWSALPARDGRVVLLDDDRAEAFAVPGADGRIVVTTGMRAALDDGQYAALLAHERAHLEQRHHRLVLIARLAAAVHPVFRLLDRQVDLLVECAADERAAAEVHDRRTVARAIAAAALVAGGAHGPGHLRMAPSWRDLRRAGVVPRRVAALVTPRRAMPLLLLAVPFAVAVFSVVWTGECVLDLGELLYAARL
ncbi:M56 family metallopeptidase [Actinoplanes sp. URMC 104]|uniref:M56 family metallopeptidase n=1 Tax=Actinoplanes sp. URMC 104 TaxID=3423409 RepID=UPI003F192FF2